MKSIQIKGRVSKSGVMASRGSEQDHASGWCVCLRLTAEDGPRDGSGYVSYQSDNLAAPDFGVLGQGARRTQIVVRGNKESDLALIFLGLTE